jgi:hypothetical protein
VVHVGRCREAPETHRKRQTICRAIPLGAHRIPRPRPGSCSSAGCLTCETRTKKTWSNHPGANSAPAGKTQAVFIAVVYSFRKLSLLKCPLYSQHSSVESTLTSFLRAGSSRFNSASKMPRRSRLSFRSCIPRTRAWILIAKKQKPNVSFRSVLWYGPLSGDYP